MRLTLFLLFLSITQVFAIKTYSQSARLSLNLKNSTIKDVLYDIENQSEYYFLFNSKLVDVNRKVDIAASNESIEQILGKLFKGQDVEFTVMDRQIVIQPAPDISQGVVRQQKSVSGMVTDSSGEPLPGVTVIIKGSSVGSITDVGGRYSLANVPSDATLVFSFVGMKTQEVPVAGNSAINITMEEDAIGIEEVVAVGYGTLKKRDVIGSISTVRADAIERPTGSTNFNSLLQGQAAGVSVQSLSGRLGATVDIKVRGLSSISAGTSPLWIIDGVPVITDVTIDNNGSAAQSPMALINPADIESIQVLKDAAATSIYGSRGSNGVIMITTKSGGGGKASVNIDYSTGISDLPFQQVEFISTRQWFQMKDEEKEAYGLGRYEMSDFYAAFPYATEFLPREEAEKIDTDWRKEVMRKGSFQNVNLSSVGGDERARYYISGNYRNDKSVMDNENLERYGLRANLDLKPTGSLELGTKINLSLSKSNRGKNNIYTDSGNKEGTSGGFSYVNNKTVPFQPVYSVADPRLYYNPYAGNPVATSDPANMTEDLDMYRVLASMYAQYAFPFVNGLSARSELSVDFMQANRNFWVSDKIRWEGSMAQDNASTAKTVNYNLYLTYDKTIGNHSVNMVGGAESQKSTTWYRNMQGEDLIGNYHQLGTPSVLTSMYSGLNSERYLLAYFGRTNYKFKDKYLLGVSIRRDGSSVFTPDYRWGSFVAFSAGWILSDEAFMGLSGNKHFLKLRGSFGQTGNANIPSKLDVSGYSTGSAYGSADVLGNNGTLITSIGVTNLTWETTNNFDIGLDFGFFNHRIDGSLAYYNKYVKDLLLASSLPPSSGIGSIYGNIGDLVNSGVELSFTSTNLQSKNFKWQTTLNLSYNHNEVKKLTPDVDQAGKGMTERPYISKVGHGVKEYYLADFAGVDSQTGISQIYALDTEYYNETGKTRRLKDDSGNDVLLIANNANANANVFHHEGKSRTPKYYGGITNRFTCKAFDLSVLVTFSGGNYILDNFMRNIAGQNDDGEQLLDVYNNYWKKPGDNAKYQRLTWNGNVKMEDGTILGLGDPRIWTNQFLFKGDFIKLKAITLGYTMPKSNRFKLFKDVRIYGTLENLYTLTDYPGWDPEGQGFVEQWDLPQLFSASVGLSVKF
ncbi:MAG: TonB-dependent receptor [Prolixibacteraceae bacterium]